MKKKSLMKTLFGRIQSSAAVTKYGTIKFHNLEKEKKTDATINGGPDINTVHPLYRRKKKKQNTDLIGALYFIAVD